MGDFVNSDKISKKYYRYFLKGLAYYTCHLNRACTMADLQAYVFLKSLQQLSEGELTSLSNQVMKQLVATGIACNQNGYFRLNELLRYAHGSSSREDSDRSRDSELSTGSGLRRIVNFSNTVTMWPTDTINDAAIVGAGVAYPTNSGPTMDQDDETPPNKTEPGNTSDSDGDDKGSTKTVPNASQGKTDSGKQSDSDSSDSNTVSSKVESDDDADDVDSNIPHKPMKQEPDSESKKSESDDDVQKQE